MPRKSEYFNPRRQMVIDIPKHPVIRSRFIDDRHVELDLRGIRTETGKFFNREKPIRYRGNEAFSSPQHLQNAINEYFESCYGPAFDKYGQLVYDKDGELVKTQVRPPTLSGLALYLHIPTSVLKSYQHGNMDGIIDENHPDRLTYAQVIMEARQRVEAYAEGRLYDREGQFGAHFVLDTAFGWVTHKEQAEIKKFKSEAKIKRKEYKLKKKLSEEGKIQDTDFTVNIVRGKSNDGDV